MIVDPYQFKEMFWPHVTLYDKQWEVAYSVEENDETYVPAANMMGKDYVAGFIVVKQFICNPEVRIVTTSVKDDHLRVLWGEIGRWIQTSAIPLTRDKGGPLIVKHRDIRKIVHGVECKISYLLGTVSEKGEGMAGHHAAYTLGVIDEASGVDNLVYTQMDTCMKKKLIFGNPNPCSNFFKDAIKAGDLIAPDNNFISPI